MTKDIFTETEPILISGVYRSGTTFLSAMLGAHSKINAASSTVKFLRFCLGRYGDLSIHENRRKLITDTHKRIEHRWELSLNIEEILDKATSLPSVNYAIMYDLIMKDLLIKNGENIRWAEKLAVQWEDIPKFLDMFPNGKAIHIYRDPRDVVASFKMLTFENGFGYLDAAFNCRGAMESFEKLQRDYPTGLMIVKAEDIAKSPVYYAKEMCKFLGLDFESGMVDANSLHAEGEDWASNTSYGKNYVSLPDGSSRWPEQLNQSEISFIEMITQPYLSKFGYQSCGVVPSEEDWQEIQKYTNDSFIQTRFKNWLCNGVGAQGFQTDPYDYEMKMVFPERYSDE
ncbi:MAG: sulfotransferase [Candidatus Cloacimonetes bacterium]|nr:sulfotransferase [Candidatus Cloacimonadota bacterium]